MALNLTQPFVELYQTAAFIPPDKARKPRPARQEVREPRGRW